MGVAVALKWWDLDTITARADLVAGACGTAIAAVHGVSVEIDAALSPAFSDTGRTCSFARAALANV